MSNFQFLNSEWPDIFEIAKEAEDLANTKPRSSLVNSRAALEKGIRWMFINDERLFDEYDSKTHVGRLLLAKSLKKVTVKPFRKDLHLLQKLGNEAAHGELTNIENANVALKILFQFCSYLAVSYGIEEIDTPQFNESLLSSGSISNESSIKLEEVQQKLQAQLDADQTKRATIEAQANELETIRQELEEKGKLLAQRAVSRAENVKRIPQQIPESVTRKLYIDVLLKECGWSNLKDGTDIEYEVKGMPKSTNPSGLGYVDYVLWGDDGKPLAVVEAKKSMADARKGKHQATLYADCLEQMHGQRPVIFYTNGFETYIWDDTFYPEREVQGFYTKDELQLLIDRRTSRKDLRDFKVNEDIAGRYYQKEAIQRISETLIREDNAGTMRAGSRKALLVMATGSGKTRTSVAIVDMLTKCNWAKRILFLADRNALVSQAKNTFNEYLPHLSSIDLTREKEDSGTRLVFSTYPTIMNKIDSLKSDDDRFYGIGHFDLIIIDEAHRSVYQKYGAIFEYFDSMLIGLTATPKTEIDRNTYSLFEIEDENPTHAYELETAVKDGFLVPPKAISVPLKFVREGIKYHELSDSEKEEYEEKFGDPTEGEAPEEIGRSALNSWLFNTDTVDKVLDYLMTEGIKVEGGDKLGKTIIFAKNHDHADFIEKRFNKNYPEYAGKFLRVIDNYETKAQDLLEKFCYPIEELEPQIAVSVDMMDTGVDAPRVVNLIFFKMVKSHAKFWQMIGRGTRLCPDLFGPNMNKDHFMIFDYCQNFEFFNQNPEGAKGNTVTSLTQRIFELKLDIITVTRDKEEATLEERDLEEYYTEQLHHQVKNLDDSRFQVKMNLRYVKQYSNKESWANHNKSDVLDIKNYLSKLILPEKDDHELARRFDIIMLNLKLAMLTSKDSSKHVARVSTIAAQLSKINVPEIKSNMSLLQDLQTESFWQKAHVKRLEDVRTSVRELMKYLEHEPKVIVYTPFEDELDHDNVEEISLPYGSGLAIYRDRVESYIREHKHNLTIHKLRTNTPITEAELRNLEGILFDNDERGSREDFNNEYGDQPLGTFIRSILGLDIQAANDAFSDFIQRGNLKADQMTFIKNIISFLEKNGTIDKSMLFEPPFTDINDQGLLGVFDDADARKIISILDTIEHNAGVA
jgi:type I restriction enzyme R subunit